ncbi:MAG: HAD family hydrolase [Solirubrobacterales bacterium]|nr:HAD family hydrolase [Solirubrobacterales bacterium]
MSRPAILLDRDGTLNVRPAPHQYVTRAEDFVWLPGVPEALARLRREGFVLGVVSNQRGVARGLVDPGVLVAIERRIQEALEPFGTRIDGFRYCPHDLDAHCGCRKPQPGLLHMLEADLDLDLSSSWMVGDTASDIAAGIAAGCRTALVGGHASSPAPDLLVPSFNAFVDALLGTPAIPRVHSG